MPGDNLCQCAGAQYGLLELFKLQNVLAEDVQQVLCRLGRLRDRQVHARDLRGQSKASQFLELGDHLLGLDARLQGD